MGTVKPSDALRLYIVVVQHTFGGRLNYHPHLHIMTSAGGLNQAKGTWVPSIQFDREQIHGTVALCGDVVSLESEPGWLAALNRCAGGVWRSGPQTDPTPLEHPHHPEDDKA